MPAPIYRFRRSLLAEALNACADRAVCERARYYNKLRAPFLLPDTVSPFRLDLSRSRTSYQYDLYTVLRYFSKTVRINALFGDICALPDSPTIAKARPLCEENDHAILLHLNKARHFYFVNDPYAFINKKEMLVWRGHAHKENRREFLARYFCHPLCDVGHYHTRNKAVEWSKPKMTVREQLRYKYIMALEGNDVATNLKWILSSNSLCFMTKPRFETWFMEGRLVAGQHYVLLRDDYADLEEKIDYFNRHPQEALEIIHAANQWVEQFRNPARERLISVLVLWQYLYLSGQEASVPPGFPAAAAGTM